MCQSFHDAVPYLQEKSKTIGLVVVFLFKDKLPQGKVLIQTLSELVGDPNGHQVSKGNVLMRQRRGKRRTKEGRL